MYTTYINRGWSEPYYLEVAVQPIAPTIYTSDVLAGLLDWADTPAAIVWAVASADYGVRAEEASRFLGRIPAGGWEANFEGAVMENGRTRLLFRGVEENSVGQRPRIAVDPKAEGEWPSGGQRVQVTGRLAEICVDDPNEPAGRLLLDGGSWR